MPNLEDIKRRSAARALRKQSQQENVEKMHDEQARLAALSEQQAANKTTASADPDTAAKIKAAQETATRHSAKNRKEAKQEQRAKQKVAAERQAKRDGERAPEPVTLSETDLAPGVPLTLHQLNAIAQKHEQELRDEGKEIASAAAKGAYESYMGKAIGKRSRHAKMRAQIAAGEQQIAARNAAAQQENAQ